jgi:hypothetical protein
MRDGSFIRGGGVFEDKKSNTLNRRTAESARGGQNIEVKKIFLSF